jgi:Putative peptidoglycan binding domain
MTISMPADPVSRPSPAMFRAGTAPGEAAAPETAPAATAPGILLADISEFQPDLHDTAYLAWSRAVVIRAMYGSRHDDGAWYGGARRDGLHAGGVAWLGIYQYLVAGQDAAAQAHALAGLVGNLRQGEKLICDIEEGPPSQQADRWRQWSAVITAAYGRAADPWLYAGLSFSETAGLSPQWVAAYRSTEPAGDHQLWQFSAAYPVPGVGTADCSRFRGTIGELASHGWQVAPAPDPPPAPAPNWTEHIMQQLPELRQGATGTFVRTVQFQCGERGHPVKVDGSFGPVTGQAVKACQAAAGAAQDGTVGPVTWSVLLGAQ